MAPPAESGLLNWSSSSLILGEDLNVTLLDANGVPIAGYINLSANAIDLSGLDPVSYDRFSLLFRFASTIGTNPALLDYQIFQASGSWGTVYPARTRVGNAPIDMGWSGFNGYTVLMTSDPIEDDGVITEIKFYGTAIFQTIRPRVWRPNQ